jgi:putative addiction module killer protein
MIGVRQYERENGECPFADWFDALEPQAAAKVATAIARMESGNLGDFKSVGAGVFERRLHFDQGYRLYFGRDGMELVILLVGGTKRRQQADIETARQLWAEYKERKKGN